MKKTMLVLCMVILLVFAMAVPVSAGTYGDLTYQITAEMIACEVTITDCSTSATGEMIIPSEIEGYPVTRIGYRAFLDCSSLTSVTIPNSVTSIGDSAFWYCDSLTSVTIPNSVTSIGDSAFWYCDSLTSVTIPNSVTEIGYNAFNKCYNLTEIVVSSGNPAYSNDASGVLFNKEKTMLIQYPDGKKETSYVIPNSVTSIGYYVFSDCDSLTSVTIPNSVTRIGSDAFYGCDSLTSVTIPNSVTEIEYNAFRDCPSLTLYGYSGSTTEEYAKNDNITFVSLGIDPQYNDYVHRDTMFGVWNYAKELKYWADTLGYDLTYEQCKAALSYQVDMPVLTEAGWCLDTGDSKTVKDVMKDIMEQGDLKTELLTTDKELSRTEKVDPITLAGFVKDYMSVYGEYADYTEDSDFKYDPKTTIHGLASMDKVVRVVNGSDSSSPIYQFSVLGQIIMEPSASAASITNVYKNQKSEKVIELQDAAVQVITTGNHLMTGKFSSGDAVDISLTTLNLLGKDSGAWYSTPLKVATQVNSIWGFLKLADTGAVVFIPANIFGEYLKFSGNLLDSYWNESTYKYFLLCYYVSQNDPTFFGNLSFDDNLSVNSEFGSAIPDKNTDDPIVNCLYDYMKGQPFNCFDNEINCREIDRRSMAMAASVLSDIKYVSYRQIQENLLEYICAKQNPVKSFSFRVACPTAVDILDSEGNVVFTVENGMANENNVTENYSYYVVGENKDVKYVNVVDGYTIRVRATETGTMDLSAAEYEGNTLIEANQYNDVSIEKDDCYQFDTENTGEANKIVDGNITETMNPDETIIGAANIELSSESIAIEEGETSTLTATVFPENSSNTNVIWSVDDESIASVDNKGNITGESVGTTYLTVSSADGNAVAYSEITVTEKTTVSVTDISLDKSSLDLKVGDSATLTATVSPANATNKNITWKSDNTSVATVNNGKVTALKAGTATITVTTEEGNKTASCTVTVSPSVITVTGVSLNKSTLDLKVGESASLTVTVLPANATNKSVTWKSDNTSVATVSNGKVTALKAGTATITVTTLDGNKTASCKVTVRNEVPVFSDVPNNAWFAPYVYDLAGQGIISGMTATTFAPDGLITRAQFAKILAAASGEDLSSCAGKTSFNDVPASAWYASYVQWAYEKGIVSGMGGGRFAPESQITREQMAAMICRYAAYKKVTLPQTNAKLAFKDDASIGSWAKDNVYAMQQAGIINGYADGSGYVFKPQGNAKRCEAAKMISVFLSLK